MSKEYLILVDSHVHIYNCFDIKRFFDEAFRNFSYYAKKLKLADKFVGILFLTESSGFNYFNKLQENSNNIIQRLEKGSFIEKKSDENCSLVFETADSNYIIIVAGQQIITKEKLEVLSLGTQQKIESSLSLEETVNKVNNIGAIPVLPWGVGKWLGKRHEILHEFIKKNSTNRFFLGEQQWKTDILG